MSDNSVEKFIKMRETQLGGKVELVSYARYLGEAGAGKKINRGGIFFKVDNRLYFEDFERKGGMVAIMGGEEYTKSEFSFPLSRIISHRQVKESVALDCIRGFIDHDSIAPAPKGILSFFTKEVTEVRIKEGSVIFLDFLDKKKFLSLLEGRESGIEG